MHNGYRSSLSRTPSAPTNEDEMELMRRAAWKKQGVLNVSPSDHRLTWPEKELVKQLGEKLYGSIREVQHD